MRGSAPVSGLQKILPKRLNLREIGFRVWDIPFQALEFLGVQFKKIPTRLRKGRSLGFQTLEALRFGLQGLEGFREGLGFRVSGSGH